MSDHLDTARVESLESRQLADRFACAAAASFAEDPNMYSYSNGDIDPFLIALRWGSHGRAVLIVRLEEYFCPIIYGDLVPTREEKL